MGLGLVLLVAWFGTCALGFDLNVVLRMLCQLLRCRCSVLELERWNLALVR
jgi:hypothetical protein